ncbi:MAG: S9 family peptidase [Planctomycetes bacterium]|nr:S9 family peptidase [Planctomycetota bacterium]
MRCEALSAGATWIAIVVAWAAAPAPSTLFAAGGPPESQLTVDRIFRAKEFETESIPAIHWSKRTSTYFTLEKPAEGEGRDLVRNDPATGSKETVVPASAFAPKDAKGPLPLDGFEFSADEARLLVFTNSQRVWRRNTRGDYWLLDVSSRELRKLGGDAEPSTLRFAKFSPDATRVAFVRDNNLYVQDLESLRITPLTTDGSKTRINGTSDWVNEEELDLRDCFRWSPDGHWILYWQFDTTGVSEFHLVNNVVSGSPRIQSFAYPKVGETNSATRLGVIAATGGETRWIEPPGDPREHYLPHAEWTRDGSRILVEQFNRPQTELRVWLVDPRGGEPRAVATETDAAWLENENPVRRLDGADDLLWLSERSGWRHAYRVPIDGSPVLPITQGAWDVIDVEFIDAAGGWVYYHASPGDATRQYLYRSPWSGGASERVTPSDQAGWHEYDIAPDGRWAVHTWSTFTTPPIVEIVCLKDHSVVRVRSDNAALRSKIAALERPEIEFFKVDVAGMALDGWCIRPSTIDASSRLPLVMHVYGEPHGQTVRDAWPGPRGLWHWMLAQQGYVVASVDNRGTQAPRGREWRKSVHRRIGILAPEDQAEAVRALLGRWPFVDPTRVGVWGWSGGGSMSLNGLFRFPDRYRTAIAIAPVPDQRLYDTIYQERYMGLPTDNADAYRDGSPITHAHRLRGNLLLIHGTGDDNCHYQGTERLIDALIAKGKPFTVLPYPNRTHAVSEGENTVPHLWNTMTRYLRDNLQSPHAPAPEPESPDSPSGPVERETRVVSGWTVHINKTLLTTRGTETERAVELLKTMLDEIARVVPDNAVAELRKVPLYFNPEYPGQGPRAEYHPGADWLRDNGRDPTMVKSVEFSNIGIFEAETARMPNFALHELAHAYHDLVLAGGFANADIQAAFTLAKESGLYDNVERRFGNGAPSVFEKSYAMTNPQEYFAETTESFFSRNDFFPFTRDELKRHDSGMFDLLGKLWSHR